MKEEGMNCRECGWPMSYDDKFCGHCGATYEVKKENIGFKVFLTSIKGIVFIFFLIPALLISIVAFPFGLLSLIFPGALYYSWFGAGKNLNKCRCCGKMISKEAKECPKCGCPNPIY